MPATTPMHHRFRHHHQVAIAATRGLVHEARASRLWAGKQPELAVALAQEWCRRMAKAYGVTEPWVVIDPSLPAHAIGYLAEQRLIVMQRFSVVSLAYGFRAHLQQAGVEVAPDDRMDDVAGWALSLFYRACPRRFRRMAVNRQLAFVTAMVPEGANAPEDLVGKRLIAAERTGVAGELRVTAEDGTTGLVHNVPDVVQVVNATGDGQGDLVRCASCERDFLATGDDPTPRCPHCGYRLGDDSPDEPTA